MSKIENLKKSLNTILLQFPKFVEKYSLEDQQLIAEFLNVIKFYEEADNRRNVLLARFTEFITKTRNRKQYYDLPFLGLTVVIAENAVYHLSIARFYPLEFYNSLLQQLRPLFQLIRRIEPLISLKYEETLQATRSLYSPLSSDEYRLLQYTYSLLKSEGLTSLNSNYIKTEFGKKEDIPRRLKKEIEISRFYTLIEGRWWIHFHFPAFGLSQVVFHFELIDNTSLIDLIDLNNPNNTVLTYSNVFQVLNSNSEYIGIFTIPNNDINLLKDLFQRYEQSRLVKRKELTVISHRLRSTSFDYYKEEKGWRNLSANKKQSIKQVLSSTDPEVYNLEQSSFNIPNFNNSNWSFSEHQSPEKIIKFFCTTPSEFAYTGLPLNIPSSDYPNSLNRDDIELIHYFYSQKVLSIGFIPWRLIDDYSLNIYVVKVPAVPLAKLEHFLSVIPYAEIYFAPDSYYLWTVLPPTIISWIKNTLKWSIIPVQRIHVRQELTSEWFDTKSLLWTRPEILGRNK